MNRPWTTTELTYLREHARDGAKALASRLERTVGSVVAAANRHRISLRQPGSASGRLLGQPRSSSWRHNRQLRTDVIDDDFDLTLVELQIAELATGQIPELCPICVSRPQAHPSGLCSPCHLNALAQAHRDHTATRAAQRGLDRHRQAKHRRNQA